jgi:hypothetical protein
VQTIEELAPFKVDSSDVDAVAIRFSFIMNGAGFLSIVNMLQFLSDSRDMYRAVRQAPEFVNATDAYLTVSLPRITPVVSTAKTSSVLDLQGLCWIEHVLLWLIMYQLIRRRGACRSHGLDMMGQSTMFGTENRPQ